MIQQRTFNENPCCTIGYFNVITFVEENHGGVPYYMRKSMDFIFVIKVCGLVDIGFSGHKFNWSNKRGSTQNQEEAWKGNGK